MFDVPAFSSASPLTAEIDSGTSCSRSSRRCAVTTISPLSPDEARGSGASCAYTPVPAARAHTETIATLTDLSIFRLSSLTRPPVTEGYLYSIHILKPLASHASIGRASCTARVCQYV